MLALLAELASAELRGSIMDILHNVVIAPNALQSFLKKTFGSVLKKTSM
tara:strand:+ start:546 stop:692 length:147 start_codon:yes stop_codon:yes gene_type:complete